MAGFLTDLQHHAFLQNALWTALLASIACGSSGSFVVVRRITYIAGGIAHCVLGGMGAALYLKSVHGYEWLDPLYGAIIAAVLAALIIGVVSLKASEREDTVISALWAVGVAAGILFISQTPGYGQDLMSYLFGNILFVTSRSLWLLLILDLVIIAGGILFHKQLVAICFDEEFSRIRGVRVDAYYMILLLLTALTVVLLTTVVGIVMVIALLTLPAATAGRFTRTLFQMMILASVLSLVYTVTGLLVSYSPDLPSGATTIMIAGAVYLAVNLGQVLFKRA